MGRPRKQEDLPAPGMSRIERPEIEEPAEDLRAITGELATLNERKRNAQRTLREKCEAVGITLHKYLDPDGVERKVEIITTSKARVERVKDSPRAAADDSHPDDDGGVAVS